MIAVESTFTREQEALSTDNRNMLEALEAHTTSAIENIIAARESLEATLDESQTAQEERDEAARDVLQVALVATKNQLWKEISWITRKQYINASYDYNHYRNHRDYHGAYEYDAYSYEAWYGYGAYGGNYSHGKNHGHAYGYGPEYTNHYSHVNGYGYKGIHRKIEAMADAQTDTKIAHDELIESSYQQLR